MYVCTYVFIYIRTYVYTYVSSYVCVYVRIRMYARMCHVGTAKYVGIYPYTYLHMLNALYFFHSIALALKIAILFVTNTIESRFLTPNPSHVRPHFGTTSPADARSRQTPTLQLSSFPVCLRALPLLLLPPPRPRPPPLTTTYHDCINVVHLSCTTCSNERSI